MKSAAFGNQAAREAQARRDDIALDKIRRSQKPGAPEEILDFLADRIADGDCHCDPTDNFECNNHIAQRLLEKYDGRPE